MASIFTRTPRDSIGPEKVGVEPNVGLDVVPNEEFVIIRRHTFHLESALLIDAGAEESVRTFAERRIGYRHPGCAKRRVPIFIESRSIQFARIRSEHDLERNRARPLNHYAVAQDIHIG